MIRLLVKLAICGLVVNATWNVGRAYLDYYRFSDAVQATTQFRGDRPDDEIEARILQLAEEHDLPVGRSNLTLRHVQNHTIVDASFARPIDVLPGVTYPWPFAVHVDTFTSTPQKSDGAQAR